MDTEYCSECGAPLDGVATCRDYLNTMIAWDFNDFEGVGKIHHLTVLAYNLQHPSVYSQNGLEHAKQSLAEFIKHPTSYAQHGAMDRDQLGSDVRTWKITGTPEDHGTYARSPQWTMRASDVAQAGLEHYVQNVQRWSQSVLDALRQSGNC